LVEYVINPDACDQCRWVVENYLLGESFPPPDEPNLRRAFFELWFDNLRGSFPGYLLYPEAWEFTRKIMLGQEGGVPTSEGIVPEGVIDWILAKVIAGQVPHVWVPPEFRVREEDSALPWPERDEGEEVWKPYWRYWEPRREEAWRMIIGGTVAI
jgi:hypothetical protein